MQRAASARVGAATTASAASHWSGNYPTLQKCNLGRLAYQDYGYRTSACYKDVERSGKVTYHFYWYD